MRLLFAFVFLLGFFSCEGSYTYRGNWNATDKYGKKIKIVFTKNNFNIYKDNTLKSFYYTQWQYFEEESYKNRSRNHLITYGIKLSDGRSFQIYFPIGYDKTKGAILDENGKVIYLIGRNKYLCYNEEDKVMYCN